MKGVMQTKPNVEISAKAFAKLTELTEGRPDFHMTLVFEFVPLEKVTSVPINATAFQRFPYSNVLQIVRWSENTLEAAQNAQKASREVIDIIVSGNKELPGAQKASGYGNYGRQAMEYYTFDELSDGLTSS